VIDSGCELEHADLSHAYLNDGVNVADPSLDGSPIVHAPTGVLFWHGTAVAGVMPPDSTTGWAWRGWRRAAGSCPLPCRRAAR
jgi:hypothetical protein